MAIRRPDSVSHDTELGNDRFGAVRAVHKIPSSLSSAPPHTDGLAHHRHPQAANKAFGTNAPFCGAKRGEAGTKPIQFG